jgi:hypothetical protein
MTPIKNYLMLKCISLNPYQEGWPGLEGFNVGFAYRVTGHGDTNRPWASVEFNVMCNGEEVRVLGHNFVIWDGDMTEAIPLGEEL